MYVERFYRDWIQAHELHRFVLKLAQSDLLVLCDGRREAELEDLATAALRRARGQLEAHIAKDPLFATTLSPHPVDPEAPAIVRTMSAAAARWGVGPMAAVAGAVAEAVGRELSRSARTVIVENGGDIYARAARPLVFGLYAGEVSPFSKRIGVEVDATDGVGVCTSSGEVGPSLSLGRADAVVAISASTADADAAATALANTIRGPADVAGVVRRQQEEQRLKGLVACAGDQIGLWGELVLRRI